jgi:hypothetical protein
MGAGKYTQRERLLRAFGGKFGRAERGFECHHTCTKLGDEVGGQGIPMTDLWDEWTGADWLRWINLS